MGRASAISQKKVGRHRELTNFWRCSRGCKNYFREVLFFFVFYFGISNSILRELHEKMIKNLRVLSTLKGYWTHITQVWYLNSRVNFKLPRQKREGVRERWRNREWERDANSGERPRSLSIYLSLPLPHLPPSLSLPHHGDTVQRVFSGERDEHVSRSSRSSFFCFLSVETISRQILHWVCRSRHGLQF